MFDFLSRLFPNVADRLPEFFDSFLQTLIMIAISGGISFLIAVTFSVILIVTEHSGLLPNPVVHNTIDVIVDIFRSIPFIILAAALVPVTRAVVGTSIGTAGAVFPLIIGITPFFTRQIESALSSVDGGYIEAAESMGMKPSQIVFKVYLREAVPSIIRVTTITIVSLIGLTAIVGVIGGGGLGDFAIRYGYQRYMTDAIIAVIVVLVVLISILELIGSLLVDLTEH